MRNSTVLTTLFIAIAVCAFSLYTFFPQETSVVTGSVRRIINPKHHDLVRLEYIAVNPERSRGWRTLRTLQTAEECLPLLALDYSRTPDIAGPIGSLRCTGYETGGKMREVLKTHQPAAPQG